MLHTINLYCVLYRELYGENCMEMTPNKHMSYFMILIMTFRCVYIYIYIHYVYIYIYIYKNYVYNCVRLHTTYMVCHRLRLRTRYNMLYSLCYILCIPYHMHYMQHTTHSSLCIIISNINLRINCILYIVYHMLCTRY